MTKTITRRRLRAMLGSRNSRRMGTKTKVIAQGGQHGPDPKSRYFHAKAQKVSSKLADLVADYRADGYIVT